LGEIKEMNINEKLLKETIAYFGDFKVFDEAASGDFGDVNCCGDCLSSGF